MEEEEKETAEKESDSMTVDLSKQTLKKIERASNGHQLAETLILDDNHIQKLENLDSYKNLKKLSLVNNQLIRMYGVSQLILLEMLDLSNNCLVTIEGLKDLKNLKYLNLSDNKIKTIEHLNNNLKLTKIDLSKNFITYISDICYLENLKELNLHGNRISHLRLCDKYLPLNLEILTLNNNSLCDLNEISYLVNLNSLKELSISNNPCVDIAGSQKKFNYRPFVKNWCSSLLVLDNCPLDDIECLKAEWLYSQGRGRSFKPGEQAALAEYLTSVCPKKAEQNSETEDMKKLKIILSKAQQHQQQLREQLTSGSSEAFKLHLSKRKTFGVPERMVTSFQDSPSKDFRYSPDLMAKSLDSGILRNSPPPKVIQDVTQTPLQTSSTFIPIPDTLISPDIGHSLQPFIPSCKRPSSVSSRTSHSSSRNSTRSTPESRRKTSTSSLHGQNKNSSPVASKKHGSVMSSRSSTPLGRCSSRNTSSGGRGSVMKEKNYKETSEEEDSEILALQNFARQQSGDERTSNKKHFLTKKKGKNSLQSIKSKSAEKEIIDSKAWKAAICIQRWWRGYRVRNLNGEVLDAFKNIQMNRMQDYITKVVSDMEATRIALEGNRKLQVLQMQAINALWKKMTVLQPNEALENSSGSKASLQNLVETCSSLNKQVEGLQAMMKAMQNSSNSYQCIPIATQTEIVAVHTPQGEGKEVFPYYFNLKPSKSKEKLILNDSPCVPEGDLIASLQDVTGDSENNSISSASKTLTELYTNSNLKDIAKGEDPNFESQDQHDVTFLSGKLNKPTVKLSDPTNDISISSTIRMSNSKEDVNSESENKS